MVLIYLGACQAPWQRTQPRYPSICARHCLWQGTIISQYYWPSHVWLFSGQHIPCCTYCSMLKDNMDTVKNSWNNQSHHCWWWAQALDSGGQKIKPLYYFGKDDWNNSFRTYLKVRMTAKLGQGETTVHCIINQSCHFLQNLFMQLCLDSKWKFGRFCKLSLATVWVKTVKGTFKACERFTVIL